MTRWLITTVERSDSASVNDVREVLAEYDRYLLERFDATTVTAELETLPAPYVPPDGALLLARDESGSPAGCVGIKRHSDTECEIKRLYVRPSARGGGLGSALVRAAIDQARAIGYTDMLLIAVESITHGAQRIYRRVGFEVTSKFRETPGDDPSIFLFMRRGL